jgi:hypothetical protein
VKNLLRLVLPCFGLNYFDLFLYRNLAVPCCMALILSAKQVEQSSWLRVEYPSETSSSSASWGWRSEGVLLRPCRLGVVLLLLIMIVFVFALTMVVECSDMPWMKPSPEAPGHLRVPIGFLPSLSKIIVSSNILGHFLEKLL